MATSTVYSFLMKKGTGSTTTYSKLIDIKDYPDLGGSPEMVEVTTLSDKVRKFVEGVEDNSLMEFNANYTHTDYATITALSGEQDLSIWFGGTASNTPTGSEGKFDFKGTVSVRVTGAGVGDPRSMIVSVNRTSEVTDSTSST